jgi:hypothetical protein
MTVPSPRKRGGDMTKSFVTNKQKPCIIYMEVSNGYKWTIAGIVGLP